MAGEAQYINPIVQAMIASSQLGQGAQGLKLRQQQQEAEKQLRQQQLGQEQQRIENEHDYQQQMIKNATQLLSAQLAQHKNEALRTIGQFGLEGGDVSKLANTNTPSNYNSTTGEITNESAIDLGNGQSVPVSTFTGMTPQKLAELQLNALRAKTGIQTEAETQLHNLDFQNNLLLKRQEAQDAMARTVQEGANQERIAGIHGKYQLQAEQEATAGHIQGIRIAHSLGLDDQNSEIANSLEDAVTNGTTPYASLTPDQKRAIESIALGKGHVIPKTKDYIETLEGAQQAQTLLNQARNLANNYSSDSSGYTGPGSGLLNMGKAVIPTTDVKNAMDSLNGQVNIVAKSFGINRTSNQEMNRVFSSMFNPARTKAQNLANIENAAKSLSTQIDAKFPKNIPASQKNYVLGNRGLSDFGGFQSTKPAGNTKSMIQLDDGSTIEDNPQNRQMVGIPLGQ